MANAQCARTREVVKVLQMLVDDLNELPMLGERDTDRLVVAFEVALHGDDAELNANQAEVYERLQLAAQRRANAAAGETVFRAPLPAYAAAEEG
ncbi:MAG TPA: hypothetical protein VFK05_36685 [Polyangiaceae bacterium]|nr:hypothetical protein [Polyangiaceae bacterium]